MSTEKKLTAVVVTALGLETTAVLRHIPQHKKEVLNGTYFFVGEFGNWIVAVVEVGAGNNSAAAITVRACEKYQPDVALFIGIAGGVKDVDIGDVLVADKIYGYESGKEASNGLSPRPSVQMCSHHLVQTARSLRQSSSWHARLNPELTHSNPKLFIGPIAAGEKVIASKLAKTAKFIKAQYGDALALEMEGRGFLEAIYINHPVRGCVIRGISDLLSGKASADKGGSQERAADAASTIGFEILSELSLNLEPLAQPNLNSSHTVKEESSLREMAAKLLELGKPPSMTMLFSGITKAQLLALEELDRFSRVLTDSPTQQNDTPLYCSIAELIFSENRSHLVIAPPGSGKTYSLWHAANEIFLREKVIPLYLQAGQLKSWDELSKVLMQSAPNQKLEEILKDSNLCILIDGWTEFAVGENANEKQITLRAFHNTRLIVNGRFSDVADTTFAIWELEPLAPQQVRYVLNIAYPNGLDLTPKLIDLLRLPLLLSIFILSSANGSNTGNILRQFHDHLVKQLPEAFTSILAEAIACTSLGDDRSYSDFISHLQRIAQKRGLLEPIKMLKRLGTITEKDNKAVPIHDLYWSWLTGWGLIQNNLTKDTIRNLHSRECYKLALESGAHPTSSSIVSIIKEDLILAATLSRGANSFDSRLALNFSIEHALKDSRLAVRNRCGLAILESGDSKYIKEALNILSEISRSRLDIPKWFNALNLDELYKMRGSLATWMGNHGTDIVLDAIAERGGSEWEAWLAQLSFENKIPLRAALAASLACSGKVPAWGTACLDDLLINEPWKLKKVAERKSNHALAVYISNNYERLVNEPNKYSYAVWNQLNKVLVACGEDTEFENLLKSFEKFSASTQEYLGYAIVDRGEPWISKFQKIAFNKPFENVHHRLAEIGSIHIDINTARHWIEVGNYREGWKQLAKLDREIALHELVLALPISFNDLDYVIPLEMLRFIEDPPEMLIEEIFKRFNGTIKPKVMEDAIRVISNIYPTGVPTLVQFCVDQINDLPHFFLYHILVQYKKWSLSSGIELGAGSSESNQYDFSIFVSLHCTYTRWENHFVPKMLAMNTEVAIETVLTFLKDDSEKCFSVLFEIKELSNYHKELLQFMLDRPNLTKIIPKVFANAFDTFPSAEIIRCLHAKDLDLNDLIFKLGTTSNPLHKNVHEILLHRELVTHPNPNHFRYLASMLRGHTKHDVIDMLFQDELLKSEGWLWLVREVEGIRGELLVTENGENLSYLH